MGWEGGASRFCLLSAFYNTRPSENPSKNLCLYWNPYQAPSKNPSKKHLLIENLLRTLLRSARLHDPLGVRPTEIASDFRDKRGGLGPAASPRRPLETVLRQSWALFGIMCWWTVPSYSVCVLFGVLSLGMQSLSAVAFVTREKRNNAALRFKGAMESRWRFATSGCDLNFWVRNPFLIGTYTSSVSAHVCARQS